MRASSSNVRRWLGGVFALVALLTGRSGAAPQAATPVDVVAVGRDGKFVDGLGPDSFTVTVDGKPRRVLWVRHVSRGPGSIVEAARRQTGRTDTLSFAAEPARSLLVVIDELSIQPGAERGATQAAAALIDRLGLDDRVGILRVPIPRDTQTTLTTERPDVRAALRQVVGQAAATGARPNADAAAERQAAGVVDTGRVAGDPERAAVAERPPTEAPAAPSAGEEGLAPSGLLPSLQSVLTAMRSTPGRKVVVIFSAGVPASSASGVESVALAAASSQAVVHAFGLAGGRDDADNVLDTNALDRLARATGGTFSMLGRNADKALERTVPELSASYVLGLEPMAADADGRRHPLRIETSRSSAAVRAPAWLVVRPDADDYLPPPEAARLAPLGAPPARPAVVDIGRGADATDSARTESAARDLEMQRLLAKATDYVSGYQREYLDAGGRRAVRAAHQGRAADPALRPAPRPPAGPRRVGLVPRRLRGQRPAGPRSRGPAEAALPRREPRGTETAGRHQGGKLPSEHRPRRAQHQRAVVRAEVPRGGESRAMPVRSCGDEGRRGRVGHADDVPGGRETDAGSPGQGAGHRRHRLVPGRSGQWRRGRDDAPARVSEQQRRHRVQRPLRARREPGPLGARGDDRGVFDEPRDEHGTERRARRPRRVPRASAASR